MKYVLFVTGILEFDSGKSTLIKDLLKYIKENTSFSAVPFKPLSGNNLYYHYKELKKMARLVNDFFSIDIMTLVNEIKTKVDVEPIILNPVHQVFTPALSAEFYHEGNLNAYLSKYLTSSALMQRFTKITNQKPYTTYIINGGIYNNNKFWAPKDIIEIVVKNAEETKPYTGEAEYYSLNSKYYAEAIQTAFDHVKERYDIVIIESFNNAAHPAWCVREASVVFSVSPGSLFMYDPKTFFKAVDAYKMIQKNRPSTTGEIMKITKPQKAWNVAEPKKRKEIISEIMREVLKIEK